MLLPVPMLRLAPEGCGLLGANPVAETFFGMRFKEIGEFLAKSLPPERVNQLAHVRRLGETIHDLPVTLTLAGRQLSLLFSIIHTDSPSASWLVIKDVTDTVEFRRHQRELADSWSRLFSKFPYPVWLLDERHECIYQNAEFLNELPVCQRGKAEQGVPCSRSLRERAGCQVRVEDFATSKHWQTLSLAASRSGQVEAQQINLGFCGLWQLMAMPLPGPEGKHFVGMFAVNLDPAQRMHLKTHFPQLQALAKNMQDVREAERVSVAREIHDNLGQELTLLRLEIGRLLQNNRDQDSPESALMRRLVGLNDHIGHIMESTRRLAYDLRQDVVEHGVAAAATDFVLQFRKRAQLSGYLEIQEGWQEPKGDLGQHLFRSIQELLNNVAKHADARRFSVRLAAEDGCYWVEVTDDGIGLPRRVLEKLSSERDLGLRSLQERAAIYGGRVNVQTRPTIAGTTVRITLPVQRKHDDRTDITD